MKNLFENIQINAKIEYVISEMEILLNEAKKNAPAKDFTPQMARIKDLREFQNDFLETCEENRIINKLYQKSLNQNTSYEIALSELMAKNKSMEIEIENLKQNIQI